MQVARPVLSEDRGERLRAQGVPAAIVASMRTFEEQQLRQKPEPQLLSPSLGAVKPPEADQPHDKSSILMDVAGGDLVSADPAGGAHATLAAANAVRLNGQPDIPLDAEQGSTPSQDAASGSGHAKPQPKSAHKLGHGHDRADTVQRSLPARSMSSPAAPQQGGGTHDVSSDEGLKTVFVWPKDVEARNKLVPEDRSNNTSREAGHHRKDTDQDLG